MDVKMCDLSLSFCFISAKFLYVAVDRREETEGNTVN